MTQQNNTIYKLNLQTELNPQGTYYVVTDKNNLPLILFQPSAAQPLVPTKNGNLEHFLSNLPDNGYLPEGKLELHDISIMSDQEYQALKQSILIVNRPGLIALFELSQLQNPDIKNLERTAISASDNHNKLTKRYTQAVFGKKDTTIRGNPINILTIGQPDTLKGQLDMAEKYAAHTMDELLSAKEISNKAYELKSRILQANEIIESLFKTYLCFSEPRLLPIEE